MKKVLLSIALVLCVTSSFARWVTIEILGVKTGPDTKTGNTVTVNCDYTVSTCAKIVVNVASIWRGPTNGDPTTLTTYVKGRKDAEYTGGFVKVKNEWRKGGVKYSITLSDLTEK